MGCPNFFIKVLQISFPSHSFCLSLYQILNITSLAVFLKRLSGFLLYSQPMSGLLPPSCSGSGEEQELRLLVLLSPSRGIPVQCTVFSVQYSKITKIKQKSKVHNSIQRAVYTVQNIINGNNNKSSNNNFGT